MNGVNTPNAHANAPPDRSRERLPGGNRADDPPLRASELARWMGVSTKTIIRAIQKGDLHATIEHGPTGRPQYRFELAAAVAFLKLRCHNADRIAILERVLQRQIAAQ